MLYKYNTYLNIFLFYHSKNLYKLRINKMNIKKRGRLNCSYRYCFIAIPIKYASYPEQRQKVPLPF